jgi:hypothetical protein
MYLTDLLKPEHIAAAYKAPFDDDEATVRYKRLLDLMAALLKPLNMDDMVIAASCLHIIEEAIEIATKNDGKV